MQKCHVGVAIVLLEAHAALNGPDGGAKALLECPYTHEDKESECSLLFHALGNTVSSEGCSIGPGAVLS